MKQKKQLVLGGNVIQAEAIIKAKELGYYVISADLYADNPGHKYADEYCRLEMNEVIENIGEHLKVRVD